VQLSDSEIIDSLRTGDEKVFEQLFRYYYQRLCNYACGILNDMDEAEETVQNVFLGVWEKRIVIEITTSLKSYLYRAIHNASLNKIKHGKIRQLYANEYAQQTSPVYEHTTQTVYKNELEKQIHAAINELPEQCRMVFKLSRFEEMKYSEIAEHLGISVKTVENHMGKALKMMRQQLKDYLPIILLLIPSLLK
jgi:RNA polymerase sigma-70 factor (ECF subfamily)